MSAGDFPRCGCSGCLAGGNCFGPYQIGWPPPPDGPDVQTSGRVVTTISLTWLCPTCEQEVPRESALNFARAAIKNGEELDAEIAKLKAALAAAEKARAAEETGLSGKIGRLTTKTQALAEALSTVQGAVSMLARADACEACGFAAWTPGAEERHCKVCDLRRIAEEVAGAREKDRQAWALREASYNSVVGSLNDQRGRLNSEIDDRDRRISSLRGSLSESEDKLKAEDALIATLREKLDAQKRHTGDLDRAYSRTRQELHAIKGEAASLKGSLAEEASAHAACLSIAEGTPGWREYAHVRAASRAVAALRNEVEALRAENTRLLKDKRELTDKLDGRFKQEYQCTFAPRPTEARRG